MSFNTNQRFTGEYSDTLLGDLTSVTQGSLTRTYYYDYLSRLTKEVNPESGTITYSYDTGSKGDLYQRTAPQPNQTGTATTTTTYTYDALHRLTIVNYNDGTAIGYYYDEAHPWGVNATNYKGQLSQAQFQLANGTVVGGSIFSYDKMGRAVNQWQCTPLDCGTSAVYMTTTYDYLGNVTSRSNNFDNVTYAYTYGLMGRLSSVQSTLNDSNHPRNPANGKCSQCTGRSDQCDARQRYRTYHGLRPSRSVDLVD